MAVLKTWTTDAAGPLLWQFGTTPPSLARANNARGRRAEQIPQSRSTRQKRSPAPIFRAARSVQRDPSLSTPHSRLASHYKFFPGLHSMACI
ncbi:hypothetical protein EVAR_49942_1 [Eumeta japonica]|uniref:Uncharacterized protein n=1 Tax=Eumeta variegata TaxID=151549 RepID=A0A4C1XXJ5_EUMVA|nr:hypothetical protein EVAR_49942_1 [Eumeta japonica]